jgi:predicted secreted protein
MSIAISATGSLLQIGDGASAEQFATIPEVSRVSPPNVRFDLLEVTSHDSSGGFREWVPGLLDGENATAEFNWVPSNEIHQQVRDANLNKTKKNMKIVFTGDTGNTFAYAAYVMSFGPQADVGQILKASAGFRMTGQPSWT